MSINTIKMNIMKYHASISFLKIEFDILLHRGKIKKTSNRIFSNYFNSVHPNFFTPKSV